MKKERFELRLSKEDKELLLRKAEEERTSMSDLMLRALYAYRRDVGRVPEPLRI